LQQWNETRQVARLFFGALLLRLLAAVAIGDRSIGASASNRIVRRYSDRFRM